MNDFDVEKFSFNNLAEAHRTIKLNLPKNMRVLKLPDLPQFCSFNTDGPAGRHAADINGRAAAIECYLDIGSSAIVRWNNYHKELGSYQGELVGKTEFMKAFCDLTSPVETYDFSKMRAVLDMTVRQDHRTDAVASGLSLAINVRI